MHESHHISTHFFYNIQVSLATDTDGAHEVGYSILTGIVAQRATPKMQAKTTATFMVNRAATDPTEGQ